MGDSPRSSYLKILKIQKKAFSEREQLKEAKSIIVKIGSAIITKNDGDLLPGIVKQVAKLHYQNKKVLIVSSGSVAFGRKLLSSNSRLNGSGDEDPEKNRIAAAIGQPALMSFYGTLFKQHNCTVAQVLVTNDNFRNSSKRMQLATSILAMLDNKIIPIVNTNDPVEDALAMLLPDGEKDVRLAGMKDIIIGDNDSLASILSAEIRVDLLLLLSNVDGLYTGPPEKEDSVFLDSFTPECFRNSVIEYGSKSNEGMGGMKSKIKSALWAMQKGTAVVICNGQLQDSILKVIEGSGVGTFIKDNDLLNTICGARDDISSLNQASIARYAAQKLHSLGKQTRKKILLDIAKALHDNESLILESNKTDMEMAKSNNISDVLLARLQLTPSKLKSLCTGITQLANLVEEECDRILKEWTLSESMSLQKIASPIGVLLVVFESRPDCLPQICTLTIGTANGVLLKGGSEAKYSNACLFKIIDDVLKNYNCSGAAQLITSRDDVSDILKNGGANIDMIIPRGSKQLVESILRQAKGIPVLAHTEGICHVYVDKDTNEDIITKIVVDAKCDYPAACNAMETLLIHEHWVGTETYDKIHNSLTDKGVALHFGPKIAKRLQLDEKKYPIARSYRVEYGSLECTVEMVDSVEEAIEHINTYGSHHSDTIITQDSDNAKLFCEMVDSACRFVNCSTRFADGYRFGLGAEVGISTSKLHARGPAGLESLMSYYWKLVGEAETVAEYEKLKIKSYQDNSSK